MYVSGYPLKEATPFVASCILIWTQYKLIANGTKSNQAATENTTRLSLNKVLTVIEKDMIARPYRQIARNNV
jgi:hypothetical protein